MNIFAAPPFSKQSRVKLCGEFASLVQEIDPREIKDLKERVSRTVFAREAHTEVQYGKEVCVEAHFGSWRTVQGPFPTLRDESSWLALQKPWPRWAGGMETTGLAASALPGNFLEM